MEKEFRTMTYGATSKDVGKMRLKLDTEKGVFFPKGVEVKAKIDLETGNVQFYVEKDDLAKLQ